MVASAVSEAVSICHLAAEVTGDCAVTVLDMIFVRNHLKTICSEQGAGMRKGRGAWDLNPSSPSGIRKGQNSTRGYPLGRVCELIENR